MPISGTNNVGGDMVRGREWTGFEAAALQEAMRYSMRDFASLLGIETSTVANWRKGLSGVTPRTKVQAILDTTYQQRATPEDRERFAQIAAEGEAAWRERHRKDQRAGSLEEAERHDARMPASLGIRVGMADVERIVKSMGRIHELQLMAGGDRLCEIATNEVRYVEHLLDSGRYSDTVGTALTSAAAEMMTAAGWVHYDAGQWKSAKRYYADAAQAATMSGDGIAAAHTWINASLLSYREGSRPKEGARLAQAAQIAAEREGGPKLRALAAIREAEAHSVIGDRSVMVAAVNRAHRAHESTKGHDPAYLAHLPEAQLSGLTGLAFMRLGDHAEATTYLRSAIVGTAAYPRERTAWQIRLAQNCVQAGEIADGCGMLVENFAEVSTVASTRLQTTLTGIADDLRHHVAVPEVGQFVELWTTR
ncbi:hypothetical protein ACFVJ5_08405 [Nocardia sp. NPDC127606]|uniref:hypothetical protein n=1 Tax=Nocardia sp. NPDC127606 TaxID=3345406 RepID=UPI0036344CFD